jgi:hypothetical protein
MINNFDYILKKPALTKCNSQNIKFELRLHFTVYRKSLFGGFKLKKSHFLLIPIEYEFNKNTGSRILLNYPFKVELCADYDEFINYIYDVLYGKIKGIPNNYVHCAYLELLDHGNSELCLIKKEIREQTFENNSSRVKKLRFLLNNGYNSSSEIREGSQEKVKFVNYENWYFPFLNGWNILFINKKMELKMETLPNLNSKDLNFKFNLFTNQMISTLKKLNYIGYRNQSKYKNLDYIVLNHPKIKNCIVLPFIREQTLQCWDDGKGKNAIYRFLVIEKDKLEIIVNELKLYFKKNIVREEIELKLFTSELDECFLIEYNLYDSVKCEELKEKIVARTILPQGDLYQSFKHYTSVIYPPNGWSDWPSE